MGNKRLLVWRATGDNGRMANRGRNLWIVAVLALLGGFAWVVLRPHEPVFEGKPLSLVLNEAYQAGPHRPGFYSRAYYPDESEIHRMRAERALRALGTNALPILVKMASSRVSGFRGHPGGPSFRGFVGWLAGAPEMAFLHLPPQEGRHEMAAWGIRLLGREARPAAPALVRLLSDRDREVQWAAADCLAAIGPEAAEAVPALVRMLENCSRAKNYDWTLVYTAVHALGEIGPPASAAASELAGMTNEFAAVALIKIRQGSFQPFFERLKDTSDLNKWVRTAIQVGHLGTNADPAIPLLLAGFQHTNDRVRRVAAMVVAQLHRQPDLCLRPLVSLLDSTNGNPQWMALEALANFGPAAKPVAHDIVRYLSDRDPGVRVAATNALRLVDPDSRWLGAE
jgi:HEAT repeat protein